MADLFTQTPDGKRYRAMSRGERVELPYHLRWLAPRVARTDLGWIWLAGISVAACAGLAVWYSESWAAGFLVLGLPGVTLFNLRHPILVDAPAMALALGSAVAMRQGWWPAAIVLVLLAGCTKETAPVFAAAWAWNPVLLVGLVTPALRYLLVRPGVDVADDTASARLRGLDSIKARKVQTDPAFWLLPWGMCLLGLAHPTLQLAVVLALAYGQCLLATDTARLYAWAFPVLVASTCHNVPVRWWLPLVAIHLANPLRGTGL